MPSMDNPSVLTGHCAGPNAQIAALEQNRLALTNTFAVLLTEKARWQWIALSASGISVVMGLALSVALLKPQRLEPRIVRVDALGQLSTPLAPHELPPATAPQLEYAITRWLLHTRSISSDPVVFRRNWDEVGAFSTVPLMANLRDFQDEQTTRMLRDGHRVQVTVKSVIPVPNSQRSYQVEWKEQAYDRSNKPLASWSRHWQGIIEMIDWREATQKRQAEKLLPPQQEEMRNPLGLFVHGFSAQPLPQVEG